MKRLITVAAVVAVFAAGAAVATAQTETIIACVNQNSGILQIVDEVTSCGANETSLIWNVEGPQGPAGDPAAVSAYLVTMFYPIPATPGNVELGAGEVVVECDPGDVVADVRRTQHIIRLDADDNVVEEFDSIVFPVVSLWNPLPSGYESAGSETVGEHDLHPGQPIAKTLRSTLFELACLDIA